MLLETDGSLAGFFLVTGEHDVVADVRYDLELRR